MSSTAYCLIYQSNHCNTILFLSYAHICFVFVCRWSSNSASRRPFSLLYQRTSMHYNHLFFILFSLIYIFYAWLLTCAICTHINNMLRLFAMFACGLYPMTTGTSTSQRCVISSTLFDIFRNCNNTAPYHFYSKILNYAVRIRHMALFFQFCASGTLTQCRCTFCRINSFC